MTGEYNGPPLCLFCKYFVFWQAEHGYSEMTPGCDASMECTKGHIDIDFWCDTTETYREKILTAGTCVDFHSVIEQEEAE